MDLVNSILEDELPHDLLGDEPVATGDDIPEPDQYAAEEIAFTVQTSGSTGRPTEIPVLYDDLPHQKQIPADGFALGGLTEDDVLFAGGAAFPHYSGWVIREGARTLGAEVLNWGRPDYENIIAWQEAEEVTALITLPEVAKVLGHEIADSTGNPPSDVFPNMRLGLMSGDSVTDSDRQYLTEQWGFNKVIEFYSAVDANVMASAVDETRQQVPLINHFVFEIIPEGTDDIIDIRHIETETQGTLLLTNPESAALPPRYRLGDNVQVSPGDVPRISVLGREKSTINLEGALLYESHILQAVDETYGTVNDVLAYVGVDDVPSIDFYIVGAKPGYEEQFLYHLFQYNPPVGEAFEFGREVTVDTAKQRITYSDTHTGLIDYLAVHEPATIDAVPDHVLEQRSDNPIKAETIVFDPAYTW